jgi:hypothetical protein
MAGRVARRTRLRAVADLHLSERRIRVLQYSLNTAPLALQVSHYGEQAMTSAAWACFFVSGTLGAPRGCLAQQATLGHIGIACNGFCRVLVAQFDHRGSADGSRRT